MKNLVIIGPSPIGGQTTPLAQSDVLVHGPIPNSGIGISLGQDQV